MKIKKPLLTAAAVAAIGVAGFGGMGMASAATNSVPKDGQANLISKIAQKFNLKEADVAAVFDEDRAAHEAEMQQHTEDKLTQAVTDGKLTEAQKGKILAKLAELKAARESDLDAAKDKTDAERKSFMKQKRTDLKQWAEDNDIPPEYLMQLGGHHHGHGHMMERTEAGDPAD